MPEVTEKTKKAPESAAPPTVPNTRKSAGLQFRRLFTKAGVSPYDEIEWELRLAQITDAQGNVIFEQKDVEVPKDWSMTATNIVASKYLHGTIDTPDRETGVRQLVRRVAETIRDWGKADGYFRSDEDAAIFHDELAHILLRQYAAFNSPVWFNVGCDRIEPSSDAQNWHWSHQTGRVEFSVTGYKTPQCSACFINSVKDSLDSILTLAKTEGMLFKWGSGTGTNLSPLRSSTEGLSGGGTDSGTLSFMTGFDAFATVRSPSRVTRTTSFSLLSKAMSGRPTSLKTTRSAFFASRCTDPSRTTGGSGTRPASSIPARASRVRSRRCPRSRSSTATCTLTRWRCHSRRSRSRWWLQS